MIKENKKSKYILAIIIFFLFILILNTNKVFAKAHYTLNESVAYAMSLLDDNMSEHEKAFILAQYCQEGNEYNLAARGQTAESVLVKHNEGVCAGYGRAFKLLCNTAGLQCDFITLPTSDHAVNICYLDGEWCYVDVTRGIRGDIEPYAMGGKIFESRGEFQYVTVENGSMTTEKYARDNNLKIVKYHYFDSKAYYEDSILSYFPEGTSRSSDYSLSGGFSRIYYDSNYKYYAVKKVMESNSYVYKENRKTGEVTKLAQNLVSRINNTSGLVKDKNKIYYVGTDNIIYSIDISTNTTQKEYTNLDSNYTITGIFVQDGYINYVLYGKDSNNKDVYKWIEWKKMSTAIASGTYTLNNSSQKYNLNYIKTEKGIVIDSCTGIGDAKPSGKIYIPNTIDGLPVIGIAKEAFCSSELEGILTLPTNLKYIGRDAFAYSKKITKIVFNNEINSVGTQAFLYCEKLSNSLDLTDNISFMGVNCFDDCNYTNIKFPKKLKIILDGTFAWNRNLDGVMVIPEGIVSIGPDAFTYTSLDAAILPSTLENLGYKAFRDWFSDNDFESIAIKSTNMKYFSKSEDYTIYLKTNTETEKFAKDNNIPYNNLDTAIPNVKFEKTEITIYNNESNLQIKYNVTPKFFEGYEKTWQSSNTSIASVNNKGIITPIQKGSAEITLKFSGISNKYSVKVNVNEKEELNFDYDFFQFNKLGEELTLKATLDSGKIPSNLNWKSGNTKVAIVDSKGIVKPVSGGFTSISVTSELYEGTSMNVYVNIPVTLKDGSKCYVGDVNKDGVINSVDGAMILDLAKTNYTEDQLLVGDVNKDGKINSTDAICVLDLYKYDMTLGKYYPITSVKLNKNSVKLEKGAQESLIASINPSNTTDSPKLTWTTSNSSIATVSTSGKITAIKSGTCTITVKSSNNLTAKCTVTVEEKLPFTDVSKSAWYYSAVEFAYRNRIVSGTTSTTFSPDSKLTRAQLVTILHNMEGKPNATGTVKFPDVTNTSAWYYSAVKWAAQNRIVSGYADGRFGPNDNITREQLAIMLNNYCKYKGKYKEQKNILTTFSDYKNISSYAYSSMQWATGIGVITGSNGKLNPKGTATRAEAVSMIYKYCLKIK